MGLDMYLGVTNITDAPSLSISSVYWRKANAIHSWFVRECQGGVDECQETDVPREMVVKLRDLCTLISKDPSLASRLLPPQSGFFFGSTQIDEGYMDDITYTVTELDRVLAAAPDDGDWSFYYQSSW